MQVDGFASLFKTVAIALLQNSAATRGYNAVRTLRQVIDCFLLNSPKSGLTFSFKKLSDGAAQALLYQVVRIKKAHIQPLGQLSANR